jgi:hypothetical protein
MNLPIKNQSRQSRIKQRQQKLFVGREEQIKKFILNLKKCPDGNDFKFILNISGPTWIGKTKLVHQLCKIAEEKDFITSYTDESEESILEVMKQCATSLEKYGKKLQRFSEQYEFYRCKTAEFEIDPEFPQGVSAFTSKSFSNQFTTTALYLDEEIINSQVGEWTSFVVKRIKNQHEITLMKKPIETLTRLFLQDIRDIAESRNIIMFFDAYEITNTFLDVWLRKIFLDPEGRYGKLPDNLIIVISGIHELSPHQWSYYETEITRWYLKPFTEVEVKKHLRNKGIKDSQIINKVFQISKGLPHWVDVWLYRTCYVKSMIKMPC